MGEIASAATSMYAGRGNGGFGGLKSKKAWTLRTWAPMAELKMNAHHHHPSPASSSSPPSGMTTFSSTFTTDTPLYEPNGVSFDEYLADRHRIFRAMFPDKHRSKQLNDEEWRLQMHPMHFLFASVSPVVVMRLRCKSGGKDYPPATPVRVPRVLELQASRWELEGLDGVHTPSRFSLDMHGQLFSERNGRRQSRLKARLNLSIGVVLDPVVQLVPEYALRASVELVLKELVEKTMAEVHGGLLQDFRRFGREKLMKHGTLTDQGTTD